MAKKKIKVMHILHDLRCGGVEKMFLATVDGLQKRGICENVACLIFNKLDFFKPLKAKIITLQLPHQNSYLKMALMKPYEFLVLLIAIANENPDVIYTYVTSSDQFIASLIGKIFGKKVVVRKFEQIDIQHSAHRIINPITYSFVDKIIALSKAGEKELRSIGISQRKIAFIPNGKSAIPELPKDVARIKFGIKKTDFIIGMVSRIDPVKNHLAVIKSMPELLNLRKNCKLVIVGDDSTIEHKKSLQQMILKKGLEKNVIFLGERKDIEEIYPLFDIYVHPSFSEGGCPGSLVEAAFSGLPIVATNVGGIKDFNDAIIMVPPDDTKTLNQALINLIKDQDLRAEYGRKARLKAEKEFSLDVMLDRYEKLFKELSLG
jgi:glycosyltransferase involved in cell wall biosynthesis